MRLEQGAAEANGLNGKRRNVVVIITDDQGYADVGCHGNPELKTPALDQLARESFRFDQFHCGPTCAPTRASLLTGHHANSTGVWHTIGGRSLLRADEWTLANALQERGFATGLFGKWHLGDNAPYRPQDRGFQDVLIHGGGGISQTPDFWGNDYFDDTYSRNGQPESFTGYCTDVWFREAMRFITHAGTQPFFCWLAPNAPHWPYNVAPEHWEPYATRGIEEQRARFYGMITHLDGWVGRLRAFLSEQGLADNTAIIFMGDNGTSGGATCDDNHFVTGGYNAGMRGIKGSPYDGGHRVACFFHVPWIAQSPRKISRLAGCTDFMPTVLDLLNIDPPPGRQFHGRSLKPLIVGEGTGWPDRAVVTDSQRVPMPIKWRQSAVMTDRWRLVNGEELYDIGEDPGQCVDVAAANPEVVAWLGTEYENWWAEVSRRTAEAIPIAIDGTPGVGSVVLTCHDWRNGRELVPWHQGLIRRGMRDTGYWEIEVRATALFRVELFRWPPEAELAIGAAPNQETNPAWNRTGVSDEDHWFYEGGEILAVRSARISINQSVIAEWETARCSEQASSRVVRLDGGLHEFRAEFLLEDGALIGAYYVRVTPLDDVQPARHGNLSKDFPAST